MPKTGWVFLITALFGCDGGTNISGTPMPQAELSTQRVEFGEVAWGSPTTEKISITNKGTLALGVSKIALGTGEMEGNFSMNLNHLVSCDGDATQNPSDDPLSGGNGDTGIAIDEATEEGDVDGATHDLIVIKTGCSFAFDVSIDPISVGPIYGSIAIEYATQAGDEPNYYRDPDRFRETIILSGYSTKGSGNIIVTPRTLDFGYPTVGEEGVKYVEIHNVGNGDLEVSEPTLNDDCNENYSMDFGRLTDGTTLPANTSTLFPVTYIGSDAGNSECELTFESNDPDSPTSRVSLRAQMGANPLCTPPRVDLVSPAPGTVHDSSEDLVLELRIHDADQPVTSLHCAVTSIFNIPEDEDDIEDLADCTPHDESGYTVVSIPVDDLLVGTDILMVTVQDSCGYSAIASTSIIYGASHPGSDNDGDGFSPMDLDNPDCDDEDILVYPYATEIYDEKDNDCDGVIDENSDGKDDDGDGFAEIDGDCNDADDSTYPGAPEQSDSRDNDCNGIIDDNTGLFDDDGDGFAETDNDCNDTNPDIHPAAIEYCDGIDNNCNGLKDQRDGCVEINGAPIVIGEIQMGATALGAGESTIMNVEVFDPDGEELIFAWQEDEVLTQLGHNGFDSITTPTVTWTAPTHLARDSPGEVYTLYVQVTDPEGNRDVAFGEITVYPNPVDQQLGGLRTEASGCGSDDEDGASGAAIIAPLLLLTLGLHRRRERSA